MKHLKMMGVVAVFAALAFGFVSCETGTNGHDETPAEAEKTPGTGENPDGKQPGEETPVSKKTVESVTFTKTKDDDGIINVTMSTATEGAVIWYTTDGTEPDSTKTKYTKPVKVTVNGTVIKAIAIAEGYEDSLVSSIQISLLTQTPYKIYLYLQDIYSEDYYEKQKFPDFNGEDYTISSGDDLEVVSDKIKQSHKNELDGFTVSRYEESVEEVKGTNKNILNVYYDRKTITLSFYEDVKDKEPYKTKTGVYGDDVPEIEKPSKQGYYFNYWTSDGIKEEAVAFTYPTENKAYYANWDKITNCSISYVTDHGTSPSIKEKTSHTLLTTVELPKLADVEGFAFQYWADEKGNRVSVGDEITGQLSLKAIWLNISTMIGTKAHPDTVGDFVFTDGSALSYSEYESDNTVLTDVRKDNCIAVVFYDGKTQNDLGSKILAVGKKNESLKAWCLNDAPIYNIDIPAIHAGWRNSNHADMVELEEDIDGRDNWKEIRKYDPSYDLNKYPAWDFVLNYASNNNLSGDSANGWYFPTLAEVCMIYREKDTVNLALKAVDGKELSKWDTYLTSTQQNEYNEYIEFGIWSVKFDTGFITSQARNTMKGVCCIKAF